MKVVGIAAAIAVVAGCSFNSKETVYIYMDGGDVGAGADAGGGAMQRASGLPVAFGPVLTRTTRRRQSSVYGLRSSARQGPDQFRTGLRPIRVGRNWGSRSDAGFQ